MKEILKRLTAIALTVCIGFVMSGCSGKYNEDDYIGKTSQEIIEQFGEFDCVTAPPDENGLYRNCKCGYTIEESEQGFLGSSEEVLLFISFDENGVAQSCSEGNRPGG